MSNIEVSAGIGALVLAVAAAKGVDPVELSAGAGFDRGLAADPDARFSIEIEQKLWDEAARLAADAAFGLHAAETVRAGTFDVLDYAVRTAPTLGIALQRLVRYNLLVHDVAVFTVTEQSGTVTIEHGFRAGAIVQSRHGAEFTMASLVVIGSQITGVPLRPHAVGFRHGKPASTTEHLRIFGVAPSFAQKTNSMVLDRTALDRPCPGADAALSRVIERHAEALLAARPSPTSSTADRVRSVLANALGEGDASLSGVAAKLKMSERTLQRKLEAESQTFDAMLDEFRRDLALRYLADSRIAVAEIAYLLGYSEPSPFHRAFKRWTGKTPTEARRSAA